MLNSDFSSSILYHLYTVDTTCIFSAFRVLHFVLAFGGKFFCDFLLLLCKITCIGWLGRFYCRLWEDLESGNSVWKICKKGLKI